jgi:hypothetical protein
MELEDELRRALAPRTPPDGFADRVAARIGGADSGAVQRPTRAGDPLRRRIIALAAAAAIAIGTGSTLYVIHRRELSEAERVRNEAVIGLRIAAAKLNDVHDRLLRISGQNQELR